MFADVEIALFKHLEAMADVSTKAGTKKWDIKKPGKSYEPKPNQAYIETRWMEPSRVRSLYGNGRTSQMRGQYQISLYYPADKEAQGPLIAMADAVATHFYPRHCLGLEIPYGEVVVEIHDLPSPGPLLEGATHHMKPVTITYWFDHNPA